MGWKAYEPICGSAIVEESLVVESWLISRSFWTNQHHCKKAYRFSQSIRATELLKHTKQKVILDQNLLVLYFLHVRDLVTPLKEKEALLAMQSEYEILGLMLQMEQRLAESHGNTLRQFDQVSRELSYIVEQLVFTSLYPQFPFY